jgi:tRNA-Thr(GGU) m(6)t(6)A37 methyltransferase TsaA
MQSRTLTLAPIGYIRSPYTDRYRAPRQPREGGEHTIAEIVLEPGMNFEQALEDLNGFDMIWVIYWFHRNTTWKPKVLPPRGPRMKRGLFATRSPHRPNPLGLSLLRLVGIEGRIVRVADVDLLDGTPVFDIKPYIPQVEAHPDAAAGWLDAAIDEEKPYQVEWGDMARAQARWLFNNFAIELAAVADAVLARDPSPHPYRRVAPRGDGRLQLAIKSWRVVFHLEGPIVVIDRIESGYAAERAFGNAPELHDGAAHAAFHARWKE